METIALEVTKGELDLIGRALSQLPYGAVAALMQKLGEQAQKADEAAPNA